MDAVATIRDAAVGLGDQFLGVAGIGLGIGVIVVTLKVGGRLLYRFAK